MTNEQSVSAAGGYGPPGGGYGPPPGGGYGGGSGFGPPGGGPPGYGGPPAGPPPGGFGGGPPGYGAPPGFAPPPVNLGGPPMGGQPSNQLAIGALVTGILSIPGACCCYSSVPLGIAAIVMGVLAMNKAKAAPESYGGRGMAIAGLACGAVGLAMTIFAIVLGIGMSAMEQLQNR